MKKVLLAGLATTAFALGAPGVAHADHVDVVGGCSLAAASAGGGGTMRGAIDINAAVYSLDLTENPVTVTITCSVLVNGVADPGATVTATGTTYVMGTGVISYWSMDPVDSVQLCQHLDLRAASGASETRSECFEANTFEVPPPIAHELIDPVLCFALPIVRGIPGLVETDETGDLYVLWDKVYDCPPYDGAGISGAIVHLYRAAT